MTRLLEGVKSNPNPEMVRIPPLALYKVFEETDTTSGIIFTVNGFVPSYDWAKLVKRYAPS